MNWTNITDIRSALARRFDAIHPRRRSLDFSTASEDRLRFPSTLHFGAATAAHQVEGGNTNNNWARWEDAIRPDGRPGIFTGEKCGRAADHLRLFDEDLLRMKALGLTMYRFSVEWSRIEPREGRFDDVAILRYRSWCEKLRDAGITPMVTLHHFTEPLWISDRGGFESVDVLEPFGRFVRFVAEHLADVVDFWVTVNEPVVYALFGWGNGEFPPGKRDMRLVPRVLDNLLLAHAKAYHILHETDDVDADGDGHACLAAPAINIVIFEPASACSLFDFAAARLLDRAYNHAVFDALQTGRLRLFVPGITRYETAHEEMAHTWDYAAVNHYFRQLVGLRYLRRTGTVTGFDPGHEKNDMGWDLTPQSLYDTLMLVGDYKKPILITENGSCDAAVPDLRRRKFLLDSLFALCEAIRDGVDVRAYLYWSLLDNFEWARGFEPRFGLFRIDYDTQERSLTCSGDLYRRVANAHLRRK